MTNDPQDSRLQQTDPAYYYQELPPEPEPPQSSVLDIVKAVFLIVLAEFAVGMLITMVHLASGGEHGDMMAILPYTMATLSLALFVTAWYFRCIKYQRTMAEGLALTRPSTRSILVAIGAGLGLAVSMAALGYMRQADDPTAMADAPISKIASSSEGMLLLGILAMMAPPFEEFFFRGFMFPVLADKLGAWVSVVITGFLFAMIHAIQLGGDIPSIFVILIVGLVITIQRHVTGSIIPSIITHWLYNCVLGGSIVYGALIMQHAEKKPAEVRAEKPGVAEIKQDLQGRRIGSGVTMWSFDSMDEFKKFEVTDERETETDLEFDASIKLQGSTGPVGKADIEVSYDRIPEGYQFKKVTDNGTLELEK